MDYLSACDSAAALLGVESSTAEGAAGTYCGEADSWAL